MDFYIDIGIAVILRIIKDRRQRVKYYAALAKVFVKLELVSTLDPQFLAEIESQRNKGVTL